MHKTELIVNLKQERDFHEREIISVDKEREDIHDKIKILQNEVTFLENELDKLNNEIVYHEINKDEIDITLTTLDKIK